tara:strand:+ start:2271 stop:2372 length:102 start_codon:yes stop_codon:yes gene_type:complete
MKLPYYGGMWKEILEFVVADSKGVRIIMSFIRN